MTVRERTEEIERQTLSPYAALSEESRGRAVPEEPCPLRTCYQRDRDRVIHSKAFPVIKIGKSIRIPAEPFYAWLSNPDAADNQAKSPMTRI